MNAELTHAVCLAGPAGINLQQLCELFDLLDTRRFEPGLVQPPVPMNPNVP